MPAVQDLKTSGPQDLKITLPVEGMTCAACQATVQRALTTAPGVTKAAVNLMTNEATVHYDPAATDSRAARRRHQRHRLRVAPARRRRQPTADDERANRRRRASTSTLADEGHRQPDPRRARDDRVDAADGRRRTWRTLRRSADRVDDARARSADPARCRGSTRSIPRRCCSCSSPRRPSSWRGRDGISTSRAWKGLRHRTADMNTLIAIGTGAAFLYSVAATLAPGLFADAAAPAPTCITRR